SSPRDPGSTRASRLSRPSWVPGPVDGIPRDDLACPVVDDHPNDDAVSCPCAFRYTALNDRDRVGVGRHIGDVVHDLVVGPPGRELRLAGNSGPRGVAATRSAIALEDVCTTLCARQVDVFLSALLDCSQLSQVTAEPDD